MFVGNAGVFGSHDDACGRMVIGFRIVVISFFGGRDNLESAFFQETDGAEDIVFPAYGKGKQGTCRSLDGIGIYADAVLRRNDDCIYAGTFAGTGYGAEITYIRYAVEQDE